MFRRRALILGIAALGGFSAACLNFDPYTCVTNTDCVLDGAPGVCQLTGFCSYPDPACVPTMFRYEENAGDGLGGQCVMPVVATGSTTTTTTTTSEGSDDSSSGATTTTTTTTTSGSSTDTDTDTDTDATTGSDCGGAGQTCCEEDICNTGLECYGGTCGCVSSIVAGHDHTCLTKVDGTVWCWGDNTYGQLGIAPGTASDTPTVLAGVFGVPAATHMAGSRSVCAVGDDGSASCWGANELMQAAPADINTSVLPTPVTFSTGFELAGAGDSFGCFVHGDGLTVSCFGSNAQMQLGTAEDVAAGPFSATFVNAVVELGLGDQFGCARTITGQVLCWGSNADGQLAADPGAIPTSAAPRTIPINPSSDMAVGRAHACARVSNDVQCWGRNDVGQAGDGTGVQVVTPATIALPVGTIARLEGGPDYTCALYTTGELYCWGSNAGDQLLLEPDAMGFNGFSLTPVLVDVGDLDVEAVTGGTQHACLMTTEHDVYCWGPNSLGQAGTGAPGYVFAPAPIALECP